MTVHELIAELQDLKGDLEVLCDFQDHDDLEILGVEPFLTEDENGAVVMLNLGKPI